MLDTTGVYAYAVFDTSMHIAANDTARLLTDLLVVPTCQRSDLDLVRVGDVIEDEKDRLLEKVCTDTTCGVRAVCASHCLLRGYNSQLKHIQ